MKYKKCSIALLALALPLGAHAFTIVFDYSQDTSGFFTTERRNTLEASGNYVAGFLQGTTMTSIQSEVSSYGGSYMNTAAVSFLNPSATDSGGMVTLENYTIAADTIVIFVGAENRGAYGSSIRTNSGFSPVSNYYDSSFADRMNYRGNENPTIWGGMMSFSSATTWYADQDIGTVEPLRDDAFTWTLGEDLFTYSVYGILSVLGSVYLNEDFISGGIYSSPETAILDPDGIPVSLGQVESTYESSIAGPYFEGDSQKILGGSTISIGERKYITELDLALLRDAGYTTTAVPESATYGAILGLLALAFTAGRRHR